MDTKYTIKNFRVFNKEGASVSLKPLTLLTGCNSSGKSSLVKSLLLISDYFAALRSDNENGKRIDLTAHKLDFTKVPHNSLGKFSNTVNNKSEENTITFGVQTHSDMMGQDLYLELVFASDNVDSTNGYIKSIAIKKLNGSVYTFPMIKAKALATCMKSLMSLYVLPTPNILSPVLNRPCVLDTSE